MNNYIIVIISAGHEGEKTFLNNKFLKNKKITSTENWIYVVTNGDTYLLDDCNKLDYNFVLINQCRWNDEKVKSLIENINLKNNEIILWTHRGSVNNNNCVPILDDQISNSSLKNINIICEFSHGEGGINAEWFLNACCNIELNYQEIIKKLIEESLIKKSKPHLIALSILCQGYLAAHGKKDCLSGWEDVWNNLPSNLKGENFQLKTKPKTEEKNWWEPALGADFIGTKLVTELETVDKDKESIGCLIKIIKDKKDEDVYFNDEGKIVNHGMTEMFTNKVNEAYGNLNKILGNC